jgi:hypothetical protein|tara:strand:- start:474 stop:830 length:357 start_codon:yes stop_codon:yes gene_type:complete
MSGSSSIKSRKAKGRALQNLVVKKLLERAGELEDEDIKGAIMGEGGVDVKMSPAAKKIYPFKIECKNQEKYKGIYDVYRQAEEHKGEGEPILVLKMNRQKPILVVDLDYFLDVFGRRM